MSSPPAEVPDTVLPPVLFEALCRAAAFRMDLPPICRVRKCARAGYCQGELRERPIPPIFCEDTAFSTCLPACIAGTRTDWFGQFLIAWLACRIDHFGPDIRPPEAESWPFSILEAWPSADCMRAAPPLSSGRWQEIGVEADQWLASFRKRRR